MRVTLHQTNRELKVWCSFMKTRLFLARQTLSRLKHATFILMTLQWIQGLNFQQTSQVLEYFFMNKLKSKLGVNPWQLFLKVTSPWCQNVCWPHFLLTWTYLSLSVFKTWPHATKNQLSVISGRLIVVRSFCSTKKKLAVVPAKPDPSLLVSKTQLLQTL